MSTALEELVAKLHAEGVESGRAEARRLVEEARREAEAVRRRAEEEAAAIVAGARGEAAALRERTETELRLAARDAVVGLRASLARSLESVLRHGGTPVLSDAGVVRELLTAVVGEHARAEASGARRLEIRVPEALRERLEEWSLGELAALVREGGLEVDVRGGVEGCGFEYRVGATSVEVTVDSVVELLRELVRPGLLAALQDGVGADGAPDGSR